MLKYGRPSPFCYERKDMPQIKSSVFDEFKTWSKLDVSVVEIETSSLSPTQIDFNDDKIIKMSQRVKEKDPSFKGTILISKDGYVLDGHHRWLAYLNADVDTIMCHQFGATAEEAFLLMKQFPKTIRQDLNDENT